MKTKVDQRRRQDIRHDTPQNQRFEIGRRSFLKYVGAGAATLAVGAFAPASRAAAKTQATQSAAKAPWVNPDGSPGFSPVAYPVPLPGDAGSASTDPARFSSYQVQDDLTLPAGFAYSIIAQWGERFGPVDEPDRQINFGYNADYTGLLPIPGTKDEYWLMVNHEYISARPWLQAYTRVMGEKLPDYQMTPGDTDESQKNGRLIIDGHKLPIDRIDLGHKPSLDSLPANVIAAIEKISDAAMSELGISILHVRRQSDGAFDVVRAARDHRRIFTHGTQNVQTSADQPALTSSGPAGDLIGRPRGTFANCSGGTTPWGTFLTCEENIQFALQHQVTADGAEYGMSPKIFGCNDLEGRHPTGIPDKIQGCGYGVNLSRILNNKPTGDQHANHPANPSLDGRQYGWVCEIDPQTGNMVKHTALGRFRHENIALRVEAGKPIAGYMGDDRRGGHIYKFVSRKSVTSPTDPANSKLLEEGTLYVAKFNPDFTGRWIALTAQTPVAIPDPSRYPTGHLHLPSRPVGATVAVGTAKSDQRELSVDQWTWAIEQFTEKPITQTTLGDLIDTGSKTGEQKTRHQLAVIMLDAFAMANAAGGTPTARPEDLEVHPVDKSVYIAFTDNTGDRDGSPDMQIFPDSNGTNTRQYGAIYRLIEDGPDNGSTDGTTFTWGKFISAGECADGGGGFACADNLAFDNDANLWVVTDISTEVQNFPVERDAFTYPGGKYFTGVFGNNALFAIPTHGPNAGVPSCFAIGPMDCELTGPTFADDGQTLILAVQHPGEVGGTRIDNASETRELNIAARDGKIIRQTRTVPVGSNFPSGRTNDHPRPAVVCIRRKA